MGLPSQCSVIWVTCGHRYGGRGINGGLNLWVWVQFCSPLVFQCGDHFHIWVDGELGEFPLNPLGSHAELRSASFWEYSTLDGLPSRALLS